MLKADNKSVKRNSRYIVTTDKPHFWVVRLDKKMERRGEPISIQ